MNQESEKRHISKADSDESIASYLGEDNLKYLKSITKEEYELFTSLNININSSYFVKGKSKILKKFRAYFIALCAIERYTYSTVMLKEYIVGLSEKSDDLASIMGVEELLFMYLHGESSGVGGTDAWICATALDRIANRKRKGLVTVVLSERSFPSFENSREVRVIDLGGSLKAVTTEEAAQAVKNNTAGESTEGKVRPSF